MFAVPGGGVLQSASKRDREAASRETAQGGNRQAGAEAAGDQEEWKNFNVAAISRIGTEVFDLVLRNLRLAGRGDIVRLARQLHRTEDKLERLLQEVETLRDELARERGTSAAGQGTGSGRRRRSSSRSSSGNSGGRKEAKTDGR